MRLLLSLALAAVAFSASAQITITPADVPMRGDTLRYSIASPSLLTSYAADSGANQSWNFDLVPTGQGIDSFRTPSEVSPLFAFTIPATYCYGHKTMDSIPGLSLLMSGISISNMHTFFSVMSGPSCYAAEAFGAFVAGIPLGSPYTIPDVIYNFPLAYGNNDSNAFDLKYGAPGIGYIRQFGYRLTRVDGWGTITTPYFTTPTPCIRVRSEIVETDSIVLDTMSFGLPRTTIEYKWLVKGEHYPAVTVSAISILGFELATSIRFKDAYRPEFNTKTKIIRSQDGTIFAYPNPATSSVNFTIPQYWKNYSISLFDVSSRLVASTVNNPTLDVAQLPAGTYAARITDGSALVFLKVVVQ